MNRFVRIAVWFTFTLAVVGGSAFAAKIADIRNTKHNLSTTSTGTVKATGADAFDDTQICVFCHTPHAATTAIRAPIWNRALSLNPSTPTVYAMYASSSLNATMPAAPNDSSKLCLSCHDGTLALGSVNVLEGQARTITLGGTDALVPGTMPDGSGATTGYTRDLGTSLTNDHPISFTYDATLVAADGELNTPVITAPLPVGTNLGVRAAHDPTRPTLPLETGGKMECISCHDPHIRDDTGANAKFLRLNRLQEAAPGATFVAGTDQVCLGCHSKAGWSGSAHVNSAVADETYAAAAATQREFAANLPVWQAGCLNCHDTHTVQGARRLLREGTDSAVTPKAGGNPALEETCYQCHDGSTTVITPATAVPNIKTDFGLARHMPIKSAEQPAGTEVHAIGTGADATEGLQRGKDFVEAPALLGKGNLNNRHAECTDCHNPHRVIKNRLFNADPATPDAGGTHTHDYGHTNIASGVLAGTTGVEPAYVATAWGSLPGSYTLKKGNGGPGASTAAGSAWVTREYQVCLKCHSDYAYDTPPNLGGGGGTLSNTNLMTQYTNQAMEFQAPLADQGEATAIHRSWHPVIDTTGSVNPGTGRTVAIRGNLDHTNFTAPWNNTTGTNIGNQTMYCSDCHGSETAMGTSAPTAPNPWGPHGSTKDFILKGNWDADATTAMPTTTAAGNLITNPVSLCFRCHSYAAYSDVNNNTAAAVVNYTSGYSSSVSGVASAATGAACQILATVDNNNLHLGHRGIIGKDLRCSWCHAAVPHGWKNKALLVNVVGDNACAATANAVPCNEAPYYVRAMLGGNKIAAGETYNGVNFKASGRWDHIDCGGGNMGVGANNWMNGSCGNPP